MSFLPTSGGGRLTGVGGSRSKLARQDLGDTPLLLLMCLSVRTGHGSEYFGF